MSAPFLRLEVFFENAVKLIYVDGLDEVVIAAGGERRFTVGGVGAAGEEDDGDDVRLVAPADAARGTEPIRARQAHVHQDEVGCESGSLPDRLLAVLRFDDAVAASLQHVAEQETCVFVIFGDEDERAGVRMPSARNPL